MIDDVTNKFYGGNPTSFPGGEQWIGENHQEDIIPLLVKEKGKELLDKLTSNRTCGDSSLVYCEHAAEMVGQILGDAGKSYTIQGGVIDGQSHAWVKYEDIIIDPTKSQFPNIKYKDYTDNVEWGHQF
jgi:hypothetical protein